MTVDLRAYTTRAKELEVAIYTQKELMRQHEELLEEHRPVQPLREELVEPIKPTEPYLPSLSKYSVAMVCGVLIAIVGFATAAALTIISLFLAIAGIVVFILALQDRSNIVAEHSKDIEAYNNNALPRYEAELLIYNKMKERIAAEFPQLCEQYEVDIQSFEANYAVVMQQHEDALASLERALQAVYDENVIFPKYRNLVAITTINEYLMSGRCSELEGPNGAYNLYEMELRQNIVISQLSSIVDNLEQIKNNQFSLYAELQESNRTVRAILDEAREINASAKLTTYFTGVTALAAISPTYYTGIIV